MIKRPRTDPLALLARLQTSEVHYHRLRILRVETGWHTSISNKILVSREALLAEVGIPGISVVVFGKSDHSNCENGDEAEVDVEILDSCCIEAVFHELSYGGVTLK